MKITDFFSDAYYINVDDRIDRREKIEKELKKYNLFDFIKRFNAFKPDVKTPENCVRASGASHKQIIQIAKNQNSKNILILEDDVFFKDDGIAIIESSLNALSKINWEIYYMSANIFDNPLQLISDNLLKIDGCYCIHAYAINSNVFDKILKYDPYKDIPFDAYITMNQYKKYGAYPLSCSQYDGVSDNVGGYMSYDCIFENVYSRNLIRI